MRIEKDIREFLKMLEEKQKLYKPYEIKSKRGLDYSGEILALKWVLEEEHENVQGVAI